MSRKKRGCWSKRYLSKQSKKTQPSMKRWRPFLRRRRIVQEILLQRCATTAHSFMCKKCHLRGHFLHSSSFLKSKGESLRQRISFGPQSRSWSISRKYGAKCLLRRTFAIGKCPMTTECVTIGSVGCSRRVSNPARLAHVHLNWSKPELQFFTTARINRETI